MPSGLPSQLLPEGCLLLRPSILPLYLDKCRRVAWLHILPSPSATLFPSSSVDAAFLHETLFGELDFHIFALCFGIALLPVTHLANPAYPSHLNALSSSRYPQARTSTQLLSFLSLYVKLPFYILVSLNAGTMPFHFGVSSNTLSIVSAR